MQTNIDSAENELIENVLLSTENALQALGYLELSLKNGRFKESIESYALMCKTLVGQRIWSKDKNNKEIDKNFRKISEVANNIVIILKPYIENIEKLRIAELEKVHSVNEIVISDEISGGNAMSDEQKLMNVIQNHRGKQISYTNLKTSLGWNRKQLDEVLKKLEANNKNIAMNNSGSRKRISFIKELT